MQRIIEYKSFEGGEGDDIIKGPQHSFFSGENINVSTNLSGLQVSQKLIDTGWVFGSTIRYMESLVTLGVPNGGIIVCLDNGEIYIDGVLKHTFNTGTTAHNKIDGIGINYDNSGTQYIYYITATSYGAGKIHRSTTDGATFNDSYRSYTVASGNTSIVKTINDVGLLYIIVKNKVLLIESDEIVQDWLILPENEDIIGFTHFQDKYKIYSNLQNTGVQYIWDGVSEATTYRQEWENEPILGVVNDGAYDYAILGISDSYSNLFKISGTQKSLIRQNLSTAPYSRVLDGYISKRENIIYISGGKSGESTNYGIYTYGNYFPGAPKALVQAYSLSTDKFTHHAHESTKSYFACNDKKVYKVTYGLSIATYNTSGYIVTHLYQGFMWEEKAFDYFKIGFKLNGGSIKLYARTDMNLTTPTVWKLIKTIDNATYGSKKSLRLDSNEVKSSNLGTFNEIQFKFELIPSSINTPILYGSACFLNTVNDK